MLDPRAHLGLRAVDQTFEFLGRAFFAHSPVRAIHRGRRLRMDQRPLRGIGAVTPDLLLLAVKQLGQRVLVMHVGRGDHCAVHKPGLAVYADVHLHAEVVLLALAGLVHLGIALLVLVLRGTGRADDRRVHDGARTDLQAPGLQHLAHLGEQRLAELVRLQQASELQQRRGIRYAFASQVDAHEPSQGRAIEQCVLARGVGQVEPLLHEVHAQHALQSHRRAAVAGLGIVRLDDRAQLGPRHDLFHRRQEHVAPRRLAVLLVALVLVFGHGQGLLLHVELNARTSMAVDRT